jgi:hypothetical protein
MRLLKRKHVQSIKVFLLKLGSRWNSRIKKSKVLKGKIKEGKRSNIKQGVTELAFIIFQTKQGMTVIKINNEKQYLYLFFIE